MLVRDRQSSLLFRNRSNISLESVRTAGQVLTVLGLLLGLYIITPRLAESITYVQNQLII